MKSTFLNIHEGRVTNMSMFAAVIAGLKDGRYEVKFENVKRRSLPLNRYYWACVVVYQQEGFKHLGNDWSKERVHAFNLAEFAYEEIVNPTTGEIKRVPGSSRVMNNEQMMEFIEKIKQFSAEWLNVFIPDPAKQSQLWAVSMEADYDEDVDATIVK